MYRCMLIPQGTSKQLNLVSFVLGAHARNYHKEIKFLAMQQDNHQQRTFTGKSNVESVTVECYKMSCVNFQT